MRCELVKTGQAADDRERERDEPGHSLMRWHDEGSSLSCYGRRSRRSEKVI